MAKLAISEKAVAANGRIMISTETGAKDLDSAFRPNPHSQAKNVMKDLLDKENSAAWT